MRLLSPTDVRGLLAAHGLKPSRALGQNFLADPNTARRIVRLAGVGAGDRVLEIGPGIGSLTVALAEATQPGGGVVALELDRHLLPVLGEVVGGLPQVQVVQGDALTVDYGPLLGGSGPWTMVSNLPYNVATPLMARLLEEVPALSVLSVLVQKEVAERLAAPPGTPACGAISVKVAYHATAAVVGVVPPTVFMPRPKVDSAVARFERRSAPPVDVPSPARLFALARAGFGQRRKTLRQALRPLLGDEVPAVLAAAGIAPMARAEALTLDEWAALARAAAGFGVPEEQGVFPRNAGGRGEGMTP
ncbi:MAG TPA: 16S rRNA (adenine(1518)-N(6)/adenine(1519)-N(6))-dimethyltransferase RsmA [Acidimicrobiia bacterium]|nr:16S rRNA (adenine(1518)-N(6)/adenine(1519)-N(6))-dimethyltransferase RsmA [Acidimicrobiia bacterium]